jgi:2',3'-cyclic-nucleotide 2'-phosphodiesterase/3'-nucleotidase
MIRAMLLVQVALLLLVSPSHTAEQQSVTVLHTSDLHGCLLPFDDITGKPASGSLAQVAALVKRIRSEVSHPVLLLDSGDTIQGTPLELFTSVRWQEPSPTIAGMSMLGYHAMAVGNHELNFGLEVLRRAERQAEFPFLSANSISSETGEPAFPPYLVLTTGDVRVGVLGLTTPAVPTWERPEHYRGLSFRPMHEAALEWVRVLRQQERCDLVVVLAHTGFERDIDTGASIGPEHEEFAWRLTQVPGIDLLLTGHSHRDLAPQQVAGVIVSQPRARAQVVTRIDLQLVQSGNGWSIDTWLGENLSTADELPDAELVSYFGEVHARVVEALDAPLAEATAAVSVKGCRLADCAALDLIHAVQLATTGAQLSLAAILSDRTPDLAPGPVTWRWVHGLYVYPNTLVAVRLNGEQVKDLLEHTARYYDGLDCGAANGCDLIVDGEIPHYNVDSMAGVTYRIDPTQPAGERIRDLRYQGRPLTTADTLTLAANSYRMAGGGGFPHLNTAERVWTSSTEMSRLIAEYLAAHSPWSPQVDGNWSIAPDLRLPQ